MQKSNFLVLTPKKQTDNLCEFHIYGSGNASILVKEPSGQEHIIYPPQVDGPDLLLYDIYDRPRHSHNKKESFKYNNLKLFRFQVEQKGKYRATLFHRNENKLTEQNIEFEII